MSTKSRRISITGLGYVGLPVAVAFAKTQQVIAFDTNLDRLNELRKHHDRNHEIDADTLANAHLVLTDSLEDLKTADFHIVATPTPIDQDNEPDLSMLEAASQQIGRVLKAGDIVVYESTVYPGTTEEICVPILEQISGLSHGKDFFTGYSPERINPGDSINQFTAIIKVVSACDAATLDIVAETYASVIEAGVHKAPSIRVAEAAKVIENTQRDLNIALINELAMIFKKMGIATQDVLEAAQTKWNFLPFQPGLVGGHCIGVDPYYLTHKAQKLGCRPDVILAGRKINDGMSQFIAEQVQTTLSGLEIPVTQARIAVLGITFKENCNDVRNTKVADLVLSLQDMGAHVLVHDPIASDTEMQKHFGIALSLWDDLSKLDAVIFAVKHREYLDLDYAELAQRLTPKALIVDIKNTVDAEKLKAHHNNVHFWRL